MNAAPHVRTIVYAPSLARLAWIESELAHAPTFIMVGRTVEHVVAALTFDPPPRPQVLVADFDAITPGELMYLHGIREQGWFGAIIALGRVPLALRTSLAIDRALEAPLLAGSLAGVIGDLGFTAQTLRIPVLRDLEPGTAMPLPPPPVFTARSRARVR
jgi:hypothetical protein